MKKEQNLTVEHFFKSRDEVERKKQFNYKFGTVIVMLESGREQEIVFKAKDFRESEKPL